MNLVTRFKKSLDWVGTHSGGQAGVSATSRIFQPYPEVTGYFIPSLIAWGELATAACYAKWLVEIQHKNGAWGDPYSGTQYAFDTGQIIRGLFSFYEKSEKDPVIFESIYRACDWMIARIDANGFPAVPDEKNWDSSVPFAILLYAYEPIKRFALYSKNDEWLERIRKLENYFISDPLLIEFTHISHFHAYILEALVDLGYTNLAKMGMQNVQKLQHDNGSVPAFSDVRWVCSTGLFQYALIWYKLGDIARANMAFDYALSLQNKSGGWYGSYGFLSKFIPQRWLKNFIPSKYLASYFPRAEISWAIKYFWDSLAIRQLTAFEQLAPKFIEHIDKSDGRYRLVLDLILSRKPNLVLDAGCGKGRYLKNLIEDAPEAKLFGVDLSISVMRDLPDQVDKKQGSLTNLPYSNETFDFIFACESLEHCVNLDGALNELSRVLKQGGELLIIDKNSKIRARNLPSWEQWFDSDDLRKKLISKNYVVKVIDNIPYDKKADRLFSAWIAVKK